ncbi:DUF6600 domain-containing protein [Hydrogenophaga sp.]|uniref:DUF6600 domain-containing protein n=1 Tax=Hydrogenophaga sp. TaxID=1904254 RepID=UPI0025BA187D|nr:DUF6600 domain-containing protein [Hydrogenophaga sp.]
MLVFSGWANADPPSRVARVGYVSGAVSFSPAGESAWIQASLNRPLTIGDRLWTEPAARMEVQIGGAVVRMGAGTSVSILNLDDQIAQFQLTQGVLNVRVRRLEPGQMIEVDTPNLALTLRQPGEFRIEVDSYRDATAVFVRRGEVEVFGESAAYTLDERQAYRFSGTGLRDVQAIAVSDADAFDRWASDRDRAFDISVSARYVSPYVIGYQDLDAYGTWRVDATYGHIWFPNQVVVGWAPYRDGHWVWIDPWGWTWVDEAPWGFAVTHYGRWAHLRGRWGWVPGPIRTRAYYAPALVVFVGGPSFQITISSGFVDGIAWFPLAPSEVYLPAYPVSLDYFSNINISNTVINTTVINTYFNTTSVPNLPYINRQIPGAVIAVPKTTFSQSRSVRRDSLPVATGTTNGVPMVIAPPVIPTDRSVRGPGDQRSQPPSHVFERPVVARTAPPAAHPGVAAQQPQLERKPGKPLDADTRRELKPVVPVPAPAVRVVPHTREAAQPLPGLPPATREQGSPRTRGEVNTPQLRPQPQPAPRAVQPPKKDGPSPATSQPSQKKRALTKEELEEEARKRALEEERRKRGQ